MKKILLQLDTDESPCPFDAVVAVDAGADVLLRQSGVTPDNVVGHLHGAMFTRGPGDLKNTAVFLGGQDVIACESILDVCRKTFFGPMRVSVLADPSGANTTAAAAVFVALKHVDPGVPAVVLGTGPVGERLVRLLAISGHQVTLMSRSEQKAADVLSRIDCEVSLQAAASGTDRGKAALQSGAILISSGAAGIEMLSDWQDYDFDVAVDLNAVPPVGLPGIDLMDSAKDIGGTVCYGALGVGGPKMKVHKAAVAKLFEQNDLIMDAPEILALAQQVLG